MEETRMGGKGIHEKSRRVEKENEVNQVKWKKRI
jgi:hypothetical protein